MVFGRFTIIIFTKFWATSFGTIEWTIDYTTNKKAALKAAFL
jgi:hypothetical protein